MLPRTVELLLTLDLRGFSHVKVYSVVNISPCDLLFISLLQPRKNSKYFLTHLLPVFARVITIHLCSAPRVEYECGRFHAHLVDSSIGSLLMVIENSLSTQNQPVPNRETVGRDKNMIN